MRAYVWTGLTVLVLHGCIPLNVRSIPYNPDPPGLTDFPGTRSSISQGSVVRVLVIHGMGTHKDDFAKDFLGMLASNLGMETSHKCEPPDTLKISYGTFSTLRRCSYHNSRDTLRAYSLNWSRLTEGFENSILKPDWDVHGRERVWANRWLKKELIDRRFSDAVMYSGEFAPTLRQSVRWALCVLVVNPKTRANSCTFEPYLSLRGRGISPSDLFVFSHSLGSMMIIETLGELLREPPSGEPAGPEVRAAKVAATDIIGDTRSISMLANQLPLLYLARLPAMKLKNPKSDLSSFVNEVCSARRQRPLPIVAYSDPNDLLSFPLEAGWPQRFACDERHKNLVFINVPVANDTVSLFGLIVNPNKAHTGYWTNPTVHRYIANGHDR